jgi:hypothetical protein
VLIHAVIDANDAEEEESDEEVEDDDDYRIFKAYFLFTII